jgi:hypothetical protein
LAAPIAYEQPSIAGAWQALLKHLLTLVALWIGGSALLMLAAAACVAVVPLIAALGSGTAMDTAATLGSIGSTLRAIPFSLLSNLAVLLLVVIPALHYDSGARISVGAAFTHLWRRPRRYLLAGVLYTAVLLIGLGLWCVPGLAVLVVMPIYATRIFVTEEPILAAFQASFATVYGSERGRSYAASAALAWLLVGVVSLATCGLAALVAVPTAFFYLQNMAYIHDVIR